MITKADLDKRLAELEAERTQLIANANAFNGAIQEIKRLRSSLDSDNKKEK